MYIDVNINAFFQKYSMFLQVPNPWTRAWFKLAGRAWLYNYKPSESMVTDIAAF